jgi:hypothetical protein
MKKQLMQAMEEAFQIYDMLGSGEQVPTNPENFASLMFIQSMQHNYLPEGHWKFFALTINNGAFEVIRTK